MPYGDCGLGKSVFINRLCVVLDCEDAPLGK